MYFSQQSCPGLHWLVSRIGTLQSTEDRCATAAFRALPSNGYLLRIAAAGHVDHKLSIFASAERIEQYRLPADRWLPVQPLLRHRRRIRELWPGTSGWERVGSYVTNQWNPAPGANRHFYQFGEVAG